VTGSNALHVAVQKNFLNVVKMLLHSKFPLEETRFDGLNALCIAASKKELYPIAKLLVRAGADINYSNENGISPLYLALLQNNM
jgi:ankyrin repeat protein